MSSKYEFDFEPGNTNTSHGLVVGLIPPGSRVLDVGCAAGYLGDALRAKDCVVHGVEIDPEAAAVARTRLAAVVEADAESLDYVGTFGRGSFDVVVLADVLEHCREPERVLAGALSVLADDGSLVISVPHVAHGSLRLALLQGRWNYTPLGLLDETHLRFYTWESLQGLLGTAGLSVTQAWMTTADPLETEVDVDPTELPAGLAEWVRAQPRALGYQFVVVAERTPPGESPATTEPLPAGETHAPPEAPALVSAREESERLRRELADREDELRSAKEIIRIQEVDAVESERRLRASVTWRVGNSVLAPVRLARRAVGRVRLHRDAPPG